MKIKPKILKQKNIIFLHYMIQWTHRSSGNDGPFHSIVSERMVDNSNHLKWKWKFNFQMFNANLLYSNTYIRHNIEANLWVFAVYRGFGFVKIFSLHAGQVMNSAMAPSVVIFFWPHVFLTVDFVSDIDILSAQRLLLHILYLLFNGC